MKWVWILGPAILGTVAGEALAQEPQRMEPPVVVQSAPPRPSAIVNARWLRQARPVFPDGAMSRGVAFGHVRLECVSGIDSRLSQCRILEEAPLGEGFGQAALIGATYAMVEPRTIDGVQTPSKVAFNVDFRLEP